ncbi:phage regulatory CII family protein [Maridesulfovibrio sp.]|uniref:phage regulatory CII family protein n=1 Tax=Maridesulfovibrio sp. TaxID=2795000 RepID=UPI003AFF764E
MKPTDFENMLELLHYVAHKAPSGMSFGQIAELMNKPYSTLANELNTGMETHKFGVGDLLLLMRLTDSDDPVHFLAARREGVFVKLPKAKGGIAGGLAPVQAIKEFGELMAAYGDAWQSEELTLKDKNIVLKEGYEAVQATLELLMCVEEMEVSDA